MKNHETKTPLVKSNEIYSPENYVCAVTGTYYFFKHKKHPAEEI